MEKISSLYHHIDNGGPTVNLLQDEHGYYLEIEASYHGYPAVSSRMQINGDVNAKKFLKDLGVMLITASEKI